MMRCTAKKLAFGAVVMLTVFCGLSLSVAAPAFAAEEEEEGRFFQVKGTIPQGLHQQKAKAEVEVASGDIPQVVIDELTDGDLNAVLLTLRDEVMTPKLLYLTREVSRIVNFKMSPKPPKEEAHKVLQNVGVAYHNLYLFLKTREVEQESYAEEAHRYYKKARSAGTELHRTDCDILDAALLASEGDREKAQKKFSQIDEGALRTDFESMEYLAAYYAAMGSAEGAVKALETAHRMNPDRTVAWLAIGDDFYPIKEEPEFSRILVEWKATAAQRNLRLSVPKVAKKPQLEMKDETGLFRPQKDMPRYDLKKNKRAEVSEKKGKNEKKEKVENCAAKKGKAKTTCEAAAKKAKAEQDKKGTKKGSAKEVTSAKQKGGKVSKDKTKAKTTDKAKVKSKGPEKEKDKKGSDKKTTSKTTETKKKKK